MIVFIRHHEGFEDFTKLLKDLYFKLLLEAQSSDLAAGSKSPESVQGIQSFLHRHLSFLI